MISFLKKTLIAIAITSTIALEACPFGNDPTIQNWRCVECESIGMWDWINQGKLLRVGSKFATGGVFYYVDREGTHHLLSGSQAALTTAVREEIPQGQDRIRFVGERLRYVYTSSVLDGSVSIIDEHFVRNYATWPVTRFAAEDFSEEKRAALVALLKSEDKASAVTVSDNDWSVSFSAVDERGGIERFVLKGKLAPFAFTEASRRAVSEEGAVALFRLVEPEPEPESDPEEQAPSDREKRAGIAN